MPSEPTTRIIGPVFAMMRGDVPRTQRIDTIRRGLLQYLYCAYLDNASDSIQPNETLELTVADYLAIIGIPEVITSDDDLRLIISNYITAYRKVLPEHETIYREDYVEVSAAIGDALVVSLRELTNDEEMSVYGFFPGEARHTPYGIVLLTGGICPRCEVNPITLFAGSIFPMCANQMDCRWISTSDQKYDQSMIIKHVGNG